MKQRLISLAWGVGGALVVLVVWLAVSTVYQDHVLLRQVVDALNTSARQAQQAAQPAAAK